MTTVHAKKENGEPLGKRGEFFVEMTMHWLNGSAENHVAIVLVRKTFLYLF